MNTFNLFKIFFLKILDNIAFLVFKIYFVWILLNLSIEIIAFKSFTSSLLRSTRVISRPFNSIAMSTSTSKTINHYLTEEIPQILRNLRSTTKPIHLVIGNEASDADSMISALIYAYFQSILHPETVYIPLTSLHRADFSFRNEVQILLTASSGLSIQQLISIDDLPSMPMKQQTSMTLVDHNVLCSRDQELLREKGYDVTIEAIIDHHEDQLQYVDSIPSSNRHIAFDSKHRKALIASTCSLIVELCFQPALQSYWSKEIAHMLIGVILLDSVNCDEKAGKVTSRDLQAIQNLQENLLHYTTEQINQLYDELTNAKMNETYWKQLSLYDTLRFDYKDFVHMNKTIVIGMSSIFIPIETWLQQYSIDDFHQICVNYCQTKQLSMLVIMSFVPNPQPSRELMIFIPSESTFFTIDTLEHYLNQHNLQLTIHESVQDKIRMLRAYRTELVQCYVQHNVTLSRKQLAPLLQSYETH